MATDFNDDQVAPVALLLWDGTKWTRLTTTTTLLVSLASVPLPADAATQTTLAALLTELGAKLEDGGNVVVTSLPAVTGTVTANAGTNLNTSALATQATLASILTDLQAKADLLETQPISIASMPSTPVTGTFWQATQPISGTVTSTDGGAGKTLKSAVVSLSSTGTVVSLVSSKRIKVYAVKLVVSAALVINFRSGGSTALEGTQSLGINGGYTEAVNPPSFLFGTTAGESLDLVITGVGTVAGRVSYWDDDSA